MSIPSETTGYNNHNELLPNHFGMFSYLPKFGRGSCKKWKVFGLMVDLGPSTKISDQTGLTLARKSFPEQDLGCLLFSILESLVKHIGTLISNMAYYI